MQHYRSCSPWFLYYSQVPGFPTLKLFSAAQTEPVDYHGERTARHIIRWLLQKTEPGVKRARDVVTINRFIRDELVVVLGLFAVRNNFCYNYKLRLAS